MNNSDSYGDKGTALEIARRIKERCDAYASGQRGVGSDIPVGAVISALDALYHDVMAYAASRLGPSRDGWKLVPTEATAEMVQAAEDRHVEGASYIAEGSIQFALWREVWRAMLAASPRATEEKS
jgi:hypothetical protein